GGTPITGEVRGSGKSGVGDGARGPARRRVALGAYARRGAERRDPDVAVGRAWAWGNPLGCRYDGGRNHVAVHELGVASGVGRLGPRRSGRSERSAGSLRRGRRRSRVAPGGNWAAPIPPDSRDDADLGDRGSRLPGSPRP